MNPSKICERINANHPSLLLMIGIGRSGTTLAKRYLAGHPALLMAEHGTDYRALGSLIATANGRTIVAKRSRYLDDIEAIEEMYGAQCRYLFLVRDPRDAFVSLLDYDGQRRIPRSEAYWDYWLDHYQRMFDHAATHAATGHRFALLRYEDLVADPLGIKTDFCFWLGIEPGQLSADYATDVRFARREARGEDPKTHETGQVHRKSCGRWRHATDPERIRLLHAYKQDDTVEQLMRALGYEDERVGPPLAKLHGIRLLAAQPVEHASRQGNQTHVREGDV